MLYLFLKLALTKKYFFHTFISIIAIYIKMTDITTNINKCFIKYFLKCIQFTLAVRWHKQYSYFKSYIYLFILYFTHIFAHIK